MMVHVKTSELTEVALDWALAVCRNLNPFVTLDKKVFATGVNDYGYYSPSTVWSQGGPILDAERLVVLPSNIVDPEDPNNIIPDGWRAYKPSPFFWARPTLYSGPTLLIAAMRCFVASRLGDEIEVPDELL